MTSLFGYTRGGRNHHRHHHQPFSLTNSILGLLTVTAGLLSSSSPIVVAASPIDSGVVLQALPSPTPTLLVRRADSSQTSSAHEPKITYNSTPPPVPSPHSDNGLGADGALGVADGEGDSAGASGTDNSSASIGTGGIIGIAVGVFVAVVAVVIFWVLWYMAKKRSWAEVRRSIKQAPRRLTGSIRPSSRSNAKAKAERRTRAVDLSSVRRSAFNPALNGNGTRSDPTKPKPSWKRSPKTMADSFDKDIEKELVANGV